MNYKLMGVLIHGIQMILLLITAILIAVAAGVCVSRGGVTVCGTSDAYKISNWNSFAAGTKYNDRIKGQYVMFIFPILSILAYGAIAGLVYFARLKKPIIMGLAIFDILLFIIFGGVEAWYASGFGVSELTGNAVSLTIRSWAAASFFFFACAALSGVDLALAMKFADAD